MPSTASDHTFLYVESDVPAGMTLSSWRAERTRAAAARRRSGILRRLGAR